MGVKVRLLKSVKVRPNGFPIRGHGKPKSESHRPPGVFHGPGFGPGWGADDLGQKQNAATPSRGGAKDLRVMLRVFAPWRLCVLFFFSRLQSPVSYLRLHDQNAA